MDLMGLAELYMKKKGEEARTKRVEQLQEDLVKLEQGQEIYRRLALEIVEMLEERSLAVEALPDSEYLGTTALRANNLSPCRREYQVFLDNLIEDLMEESQRPAEMKVGAEVQVRYNLNEKKYNIPKGTIGKIVGVCIGDTLGGRDIKYHVNFPLMMEENTFIHAVPRDLILVAPKVLPKEQLAAEVQSIREEVERRLKLPQYLAKRTETARLGVDHLHNDGYNNQQIRQFFGKYWSDLKEVEEVLGKNSNWEVLTCG